MNEVDARSPQVSSSLAVSNAAREAELADCKGKRIGVLIVAYNAVTTLRKVLDRIPPVVWDNVEQVVVFDDASPDATYELAVGIKAVLNNPKFEIIRNKKNLGYGGNQKAGYKYLYENGFDIAVLLHGDGQYAPEVLSHIYHPLVTGEADAVFGSRMMKTYGGPLKGGMPLYKYVGNRVLTEFENRALGMNLTEFHSGYRAYNLHALAQIDFSKMTDNFHYDTEIIIKLNHQGFRIHEVPIPTYYGNEICYVNGMKYAKDVFHAVRRYNQTTRSGKCYPEFEEYFVHYPLKQSKFSSHYYFQKFTGSNQQVLELGCGEGFFASALAENGNTVTGVNQLQAPKIHKAFEQYISADLNDRISGIIPAMHRQSFDRILLMDVLEHLLEPDKVLKDCHSLLKPQGQILVSVPNVANIYIRLSLLFGQFNYTDRGILDRTHFRFFTRKSARRLLADSGYEIVSECMSVIPIELQLGISAENALAKALNFILAVLTFLLPTLMGYQCIFVARSSRQTSND